MLLPMAFPRKFCKKWVIKVDTSTWYIFQNVTREREASKTVILITQHPSSIRFYRSLGRKCLIERFSYYAIPISWIKLRHVRIQFLEQILRFYGRWKHMETNQLVYCTHLFTGFHLPVSIYTEKETHNRKTEYYLSLNIATTITNYQRVVISPFHTTGLFLYLLIIPENQRFSEVFRGCRMRSLALIGFNRLIANVITAILFICIDSGGNFR